MKFNIKNELPLVALIMIPLIYLKYIWNELPYKVPMHWNINGEVDRYGSKIELMIVSFALPVFVYLLFTAIPIIDPKGKLNNMGNKFNSLKVATILFTVIISLYIIYSARSHTGKTNNFLLLVIGGFYIVLGNYFKTIRPNYFIGMRNPWTLENEEVWKKTQQLNGYLWVITGLIIIIVSLLFSFKTCIIIFLILTSIVTIMTLLYSYRVYNKIKKTSK